MIVLLVHPPHRFGFGVFLLTVFFLPDLARLSKVGLLRLARVDREHGDETLDIGAVTFRAGHGLNISVAGWPNEPLEAGVTTAAGVFVNRHRITVSPFR